MKKATVVYFEFDDGTAELAVGDHADEVMRGIGNGAVMAHIHGGGYRGRKMDPVSPMELVPRAAPDLNRTPTA